MIQSPEMTNTSSTTTTSYAQLEAAASGAKPRVYLRVENTDDTDNIVIGEGAAASEVAIATVLPGKVMEWKLDGGLNLVPQGRLALKSSANTPAFQARTGKIGKHTVL